MHIIHTSQILPAHSTLSCRGQYEGPLTNQNLYVRNLIHERQFRKCCIKYDYPAQAALPGLASVSLTAPGLSTRDGGDCLFGFGCSQQSPVLNISSTLRYTSHITPWVLSLTRLRVTITRAPMPTWGGARTEL